MNIRLSIRPGVVSNISIYYYILESRARVAQWVKSLDYLTTHTSLSPLRRGFAPGFVNYKKGCTRLAAASYKVYQLLAHGRWFSPGTPASSTTKTGRHDIAGSGVKHAKNQINYVSHLPLFIKPHYHVPNSYYSLHL